MQIHVIANDFHGQWYDRRLTAMFVMFLRRLQPDAVWINGDAADFSMLSTKYRDHKKYPKWTLKDELWHTSMILHRIGEAGSFAMHFLEGNHENRWNKYLLERADKFWGMPTLKGSWAELNLDFDSWHPYSNFAHITPKFIITHGELIRKNSGETARAHLGKYGVSLIHGHSHRMGAFFETKLSGTKAAWENGCMCQLRMPGQEGPNNWQQGWSVVYVDGDRFHVVQVPVVEYRYVWQGTEFVFRDKDQEVYRTLPTAAKL